MSTEILDSGQSLVIQGYHERGEDGRARGGGRVGEIQFSSPTN